MELGTFLLPADEDRVFSDVKGLFPTVVLLDQQGEAVNSLPSELRSIQLWLSPGQPSKEASRVQWLRCSRRTLLDTPCLEVGRMALLAEPEDPAMALFAAIRKSLRRTCTSDLETYNPRSSHHDSRPVKGLWVGPAAALESRNGGCLASNSSNVFYRVRQD